ncbi:MAG: ketoacyl-synthetase C-terminal extension domain-containing protein, partial [Psychrobium sp.]
TPIYINTQTKDWPISSGQRRMAAINSFGHSGTNSHLVVSEYIPVHSELKKVNLIAGDIERLIVISAKTKESLDDYLKALLHWLENPNHILNTELQTVAYTLQTARESMRHRAAFIAKNLEELKLQLINRINKGSESNLTESDVTSIAQQWLSGSEVNWKDYWPKSHSNKRCHLPVYPFAKERYWNKMPDSIPSEMPIARNQQLLASSKVKGFQKVRVISNEETRLVFSEPAWIVPRQDGKIRTGRCHLILIDVAKAHAQMLKASLEKRNLAPIVNHLTASGITQATRYQALTNELIQLVQSTQNLERIELIIASKKTESRLLIGLNALLRTASLELSIESRCLWVPTHTKGLTQQQLMHIAEKIQYSPATNSPLLSLQSKGVWTEWRWQELIDHEQRLNDLKSKGPITDWHDSGVYVITGGM